MFLCTSGENLATYSLEPATSMATLSHKLPFEPHTLGVTVGQWLAIANGSAVQHSSCLDIMQNGIRPSGAIRPTSSF